jgi:outer membrane protein assembly factor BamD
MAHYRLMAKADRDQTEAELAEAELKEFLLKYPDSPVIPRVTWRLREAQEVLAQGDYWTANFYYTHGAYLAARSRFQEIVDKYPNYSGGDAALYYLGQSLEHLRRGREATPYYARVITDFPLSPYAADAKDRLTAMQQPIPRPTRATLARAQADATRHSHRDLLSKLGGVMASAPDTSATLHGPVRLGGPQAGEVEVAKGPPTGVAPLGNAAIVAQPVGDASLTTGKPVDPKTEPNSAKPNETAPDQSPSGSTTPSEPAKKKSRFHALKKIIKPF